ncbi:MAG: BTAD domain-containing putative transcriptional regulator [Gemmatimonadales bacterium]
MRLLTLGGLSVEGGKQIRRGAASQRKALALLALLGGAGRRGLSRDKLVAYLWPDSSTDHALHSLTQLLYSLRRDLAAESLFLGTTDLSLNPELLAVDLAEFISALEAGDFTRAVGAYGGPFLDGFFLAGVPEFERWVEGERTRLAQRYLGALESLAAAASRRGDAAAAAEWWWQAAEADPLNARIVIGCMTAMADAGDRAGALRFAKTYEGALRAEVGTDPDPGVVALADRLRNPPPQAPIAAPTTPAIAVLPFVNLTPDQENEYFSDGMTEELSNALARVPGLRVAARSSAFAFKGKDIDARDIAVRLGVNALVEGSVRKIGNRIRLTAQLIDAADGCHLWSETYERTLDDVFALQEELARAIVAVLPVSAHSVPANLVHFPTPALNAYTLYLRGRYATLKRTEEGFALGIEYFEQALEADPHYALAHAGLAECWALRGFGEFGDLDPNHAMPRARAAALEALRCDPRSSQAHTWLGVVHFLFDWDWARAEGEFRQALQIQPENVYAQTWYAVLLAQLGRHGESLRWIHQAEALDPLSPVVQLSVGRCYYFARRHREALERFQILWRAEPGHRLITAWLARALAATGRHGEAIEELGKVTTSGYQQSTTDGLQALLLAGAGRRAEAVTLCRRLQQELKAGGALYATSYLATALFQLGERDAAFELLEQGMVSRSAYMPFVGEPTCDALRQDPRFGQLLARLGLPA